MRVSCVSVWKRLPGLREPLPVLRVPGRAPGAGGIWALVPVGWPGAGAVLRVSAPVVAFCFLLPGLLSLEVLAGTVTQCPHCSRFASVPRCELQSAGRASRWQCQWPGSTPRERAAPRGPSPGGGHPWASQALTALPFQRWLSFTGARNVSQNVSHAQPWCGRGCGLAARLAESGACVAVRPFHLCRPS